MIKGQFNFKGPTNHKFVLAGFGNQKPKSKKQKEIQWVRAGIDFGDWKKPWEKMSEKERQREVMARVKGNIEREGSSSMFFVLAKPVG